MPKNNGPSRDEFLKDVATHSMTVLLDQGVYRHLKFKGPAPNSWNQWFELITTPSLLTVHGDMGTWCFSRVEDMFKFFRRSDGGINPSYWAEKLQVGMEEAEKFDGDGFKHRLIESLEDYSLNDESRAAVIEQLDEIDFNDNEHYIRDRVNDIEEGSFRFQDTWEISGKAYTFRFIWCLHSIVWGIEQYDALSATDPAMGKSLELRGQ